MKATLFGFFIGLAFGYILCDYTMNTELKPIKKAEIDLKNYEYVIDTFYTESTYHEYFLTNKHNLIKLKNCKHRDRKPKY